MPGIAALQVPCEVKVQAFSLPVKVAVEGKAILWRNMLGPKGRHAIATTIRSWLGICERLARSEGPA